MYVYKPLQPTLPLGNIAEATSGSIEGDESAIATNLCSIEEPKASGITFFTGSKLDREKLASFKNSGLAALLVSKNFETPEMDLNIPLIRTEKPREAFLNLIPLFFEPRPKPTGVIHETAIVPESCSIGSAVDIGPYVVLGERVEIKTGTILYPHVVIYNDVKIGENCTIHAGVTLRENSTIGNNCSIQPGAVIGSDGFGYIPHPQTGIAPVPQVGVVNIEDGVDVGALSCVDRATLGSTHIGSYAKLDNLVQVGHNVRIGQFSILCAQTGIAGSSTIGQQVTLGGNCGVADHIKIADNVRVGGKGAVIQNLSKAGDYLGNPAVPAFEWKRQRVALQKLSKVVKKLLRIIEEKTTEK